MDIISFLVLLVISAVVSAVLHYGFKYYVSAGIWSFLSKIVVGWIGGWIGTMILGQWVTGVNYGEIYFIPAALGSVSALILAVDVGQMLAGSGKKK